MLKPKQTPLRSGFTVSRIARVLMSVFVLSNLLLSVYTYTRVSTPARVQAATSSNLNFQARLLQANGALVADGYYNIEFKLYDASTGGTNLWTEDYYDANGVTAGQDNRVRVVNGYLSVSLGSQTAFPAINWDQDLWITMNVGGTAQTATPTYDGEMTPRLKLTAVPYAFQAQRAEQLAKTVTGFLGQLQFAASLGQDTAYTLVDPGYATAEVCLKYNGGASSNCSGAGGGVTGSGTINRLAFFNATGSTIADSYLLQGATSLTVDNDKDLVVDTDTLYVDAQNGRVGVGTATPGFKLDVVGGTGIVGQFSGRVKGGDAVNNDEFATLGQVTAVSGAYIQNVTTTQTNANFNISSVADASITGVLKARAAQSVDVLQVQDSSGNPVFGVDKSGNVIVAGNTTLNGGQFTNVGATLNTALALADFPSNGAIGTNTATVDTHSTFDIPQTTAGRTLSLPTPTSTTAGRIAYVLNTGSTDFTMHGVTIAFGYSQTFIWNGAAWIPQNIDGAGSGATGIGTIDSVSKSANGAVISGNNLILQTADATYPGLISATTQTIAGAKTLTGALTVNNTAYINTNSATAFKVEQNGVNNNTLVVDTTNGNVGIGTAPSAVGAKLQVTGNISATSGVYANSYLQLNNSSVSAAALTKLVVAGSTGITTGDVVVLDSSAQPITTTTARDVRVYGVSVTNSAAAVSGSIAISGNTTVNADTAAVAIGDQLVTSTTAGAVTVDNNATTGILGYATTSKAGGAPGTVGVRIQVTTGQSSPYFRTNDFKIQDSSGATNLFVVDGTNSRLAVGPAAVPANGVLTVGTNTTTAAGGLYFGTDTNLYRSAADILQTDDRFLVSRTNTNDVALSARISADTLDRFNVTAGGTLQWGPGNAALDTNLYRSVANTLKTDDTFVANGGAFVNQTGGIAVAGITSTGVLEFGTGAAARDTNLYRSAADTLMTDDSLIVGAGLSVLGTQFTNNGSTLNTTLALGDFDYTGSGNTGSIGSAATTVDVATSIAIAQTTANQALTLATPTSTVSGRVLYISNTGSVNFSLYGTVLPAGATQNYVWNGTAWSTLTGTGVTAVGTIDSQTKSANGAVITGNSIVLQTADATNVGIVSTGSQTFAGNKTFNGTLTVANTADINISSATALQVRNGGTTTFVVDTAGNRVGIGGPAANSILTVGTNTSTAAGGITFGTDTSLYRFAANTLMTDGAFLVGNGGGNCTSVKLCVGTSLVNARLNQLGTANILELVSSGTNVATVSSTGAALFQNSTNSTTAFRIQDSAGTTNVLAVDTINGKLVAGAAATGFCVTTAGNLSLSGGDCGSATSKLSVATTSLIGATINQNGSGNILQLQDSGTNVATVSSTGAALFQNSADSTTAFQIQNSAAQTLLVADTTNQRLAVGPAAVPANGVLTVGTNTTTAAGGLYFGTDTSLFRADPSVLRTNGSFVVGNGGAQVIHLNSDSTSAQIKFGASLDTNLYRSAANILMTDDALTVAGATTLQSTLSVTGVADFTSSVAFKKGTDFATTGTANDANFGEASLIRLTGASAQTITGIANGRDGEILTIVNAAAQAATLTNNDAGSVAANRIITGTGSNVTLTAGSSINLIYDSSASFWRVTGSVAATGGSGVNTIGAVDTTPTTADGARISGTTLHLQYADATYAGLVSANTQTIAGAKTLTGALTVSNTVDINTNSTTALQVRNGATALITADTTNGRVSIGTAAPANGILTVGTNTTAATGGIYFGTDAGANLYRSGSSTLKTDGSLQVAGGNLHVLNPAGQLLFATDTNLYRSAADTLKTDDTLIAAAGLQAGSSSQFQVNGSGNLQTTGTGYINTNSATAFKVEQSGVNNNTLVVDTSTGRVGIGKAPVNGSAGALDVASSIFSGANIQLGNSSLSSATYSKVYAVNGALSTGDVVSLDPVGVKRSTIARDPSVIGISVNGLVGGYTSVAFSGNTQVTADTGAVAVGDQLVTSATAGQVMADNNATTGIVGYAYTAKAGGSSGLVSVVVRAVNGQASPYFRTNDFKIQDSTGATNLFVVDGTNSRLAVGPAAVPANGVLTVGTDTTTAAGGLYFGTDTNLYRSAANQLRTNSQLAVVGQLLGSNDVYARYTGATQVKIGSVASGNAGLEFGSAGDTNLYRSAADTLKTDDSLIVGTIGTGGTSLLCYDATNKLSTCSSAPGAGSYIYNGTGLQTTANFNIQSAAAGSVGGIIRGATSQTADLFQLQNSAGTVLSKFDVNGSLSITQANNTQALRTLVTGDTQPRLIVRSHGIIEWGDGTATVDTNLYRSAANVLKTDGLLDLSANTGNQPVSSGGIGDKLALYSSSTANRYGFGIQSSELVAYTGASGVLSVRSANTSGAASTGALHARIGPVGPSSESGITLGSASDTNLYRSAADTLKTDDALIVQGAATINNTAYINTNSATAFKVEQNGVNNNTLVVDTTNGRVGVGKVPVIGAAGSLEVSSSIYTGGNLHILNTASNAGSTVKYTVLGTGGANAADVVIGTSDSGNYRAQTTTTARDTRVLGVNGTTGAAGSSGTIVIAGNITVNYTGTAPAIGDQLVTSTVAGAVMVDNNATAGILGYATSAGSAGTVGVRVQIQNGQSSPYFRTNDFRVQDATGATDLFRVDGTNSRLAVGPAAVPANSVLTVGTNTTTPAGGITFGTDTSLYRLGPAQLASSGEIRSQRANATDAAFTGAVNGDTTPRYLMQADGKILWGDGTAARDTNLYRDTADTLKTDDSLLIAGNTAIGVTTAPLSRLLVNDSAGSHTGFAATAIMGVSSTATTASNALVLHNGTSTVLQVRGDGSASIGAAAVPANGILTVGTNTTTAAGGIFFGTDAGASLYRSGSSTLRTGGAFQVAGPNLHLISNTGQLWFGSSGDTNLYRDTADTLKTDDAFVVAGATTLQGTLAVTGTSTFTGLSTFNGGLTVATGSTFTNASSTLLTAKTVTDPTTGNFDTAANSVDVATTFNINENIASQALTIPSPTVNTSGRIIYINNVGTQSFTIGSVTLGTGSSASFIWNGSTWIALTTGSSSTGVTSIGTIDTPTKSADGAHISGSTLYLQNADATYAGLVSATTQTIAGAKTLTGALTVTNTADINIGSTTALQVRNGATALLTADTTNGRVSIGTAAPANGILTVGTNTTTAAGGVYFGTDVNLYRGAANRLETDDVFLAAIQVQSNGVIVSEVTEASQVAIGALGPSSQAAVVFGSSSDTNLYRSAADTLKTDDALIVAGATTLQSTLGVTGASTFTGLGTFNGGLTVATGSQFTNASSTLLTAITNVDTTTNTDIGTAATTVDVATTINKTQTTAGRTLTLPTPTSATAGRIIYINSVAASTQSFTMYGVVIAPNTSASFIWNGSAWVATGGGSGVNTIGTIDSQTKSANGAVISGSQLVLQTADATNVGIVSTGSQTFAGNKTFNGTLTVANTADINISSATALQVRNGGTTTFVVDTAGNRVGIGGPAANSILTVGTNTSTAAGGITFGTDTNLYRSAADTLRTDDNLIAGGATNGLFVGDVGWTSINAYGIGHTSHATSTDYSLLSTAAGQTILNASTGQGIYFRINNDGSSQMAFSASGLALQGTSNNLSVAGTGSSTFAGNVDIAGTLRAGTSDAFQVAANGALTAVGLNSGTGLIQGTGGLTITGDVAFKKGTDYSAVGSTNDVAFASTGALFRLTGASAQTITGIAGGVDGRVITLVNSAAQTATLANSSGSSSAANRIVTGTGADLLLPAGGSISLVYDSSDAFWRVVGSVSISGGGGANQQLSNLSGTVAINLSLLANADNTLDLGSAAASWRTLYADTSVLTPNVDVATAGALGIGNATATSVSICNSANCDTISIATNGDADTIQVGDASDTFTLTAGAASTFVINGVTVDATEFNLLNGHGDAGSTLVDTNDAVATAITGTGALNSGSITNGFGAIDTGADNITTTGTLSGGTLNTGGTQRIDGSGNLVNLGNITASGATTISTGSNGNITINANGTGTFIVQDASTFNGTVDIAATTSFATKKATSDYTAAGPANNVAISTASLVRLDTSGVAQTITGIVAGRDGQYLTLVNADVALNVTLSNLSGSSSAANQISTGTGSDVTIQPGGSITLVYDSGASLWRMVGSVATTTTGSSGAVFLQGGNSFAADAVLGTNDATYKLIFETEGTSKAQITTAGDFEFLAAATLQTNAGNLTIDSAAVLNLGTTDATSVEIAKTGVATTINGSLTVDQASTFTGAASFTASGTGLSVTNDAQISGHLGINVAPNANNRLSVNSLTTADTAAQVAIGTGGTGNKGLVIQTVAGQTANPFQIQSSVGGLLAAIDNSGSYFTGGTLSLGSFAGLGGTNKLFVSTGSATVNGQIIRGAASQSADLFQLQDSTGAILTAFQADGKLAFGPSGSQDTNLYRSAANTLRTGSNLVVDGTSTLTGNVAIGTAVNAAYKLNVLSTVTDPASGQMGVISALNSTQTAANANNLTGVYGNVTVSGTGGNTGVIAGITGTGTYNNTGTGTNINGGTFYAVQGASGGGASTVRGLYSRVDNNSTNAITNGYGLNVASNIGAGNITSNTGILISALTGTSSAYGIQIDTPSAPTAAALYLSGTGGTAASGIKFGTDTNLYRSNSSELTTNSDLVIQGNDLSTNQTTFNLINTNATTLNIGGAVTAAGGGLNLAGGSGAGTGCSIDGTNGNLTCSGTITGSGGNAAFLQNGNSFAADAVLGTNDATYKLIFETEGTSKAQITTAGDFEFLAAATLQTNAGNLTIDSAAVLNLGTTDATSVEIAKTGVATTINGSLTVDQASTFTGAVTVNNTADINTSSTTALQVRNAGTALITADTTNGRVSIGTAAPANGVLTIGTSSTTDATGGVYFGTDTSLYRSGAGSLTTGGDFTALRNANSYTALSVANSNAGASAGAWLQLVNDLGSAGGFFLNSSTNAAYGGASSINLVNAQAGPVAIGTSNAVRLTIAAGGDVSLTNDLAVNGGDITSTSATVNLFNGATPTAINLGSSANARAISIGTGAADQDIVVGSTATGSTLALNTATSFALDGVAGTTYSIGASTTTGTIAIGGTAQTGAITLGQSTATNTISIGSAAGTSATQTIDIAGGTSTTSGGKVVNIANGTPGAGTTNTIAVGAGGTTTGTVGVTLGSIGNANHTTTIQGGNAANAILLNTEASGGIDINAGTDGLTIDSTGTISIDAATASNFTVTGTGQSLTLAAAGGGAQQLIMQSAGTGVDAVRIQASAGGIDIDSSTAIDIASGTTLSLTSTGSNNINITPGGGTNTGVVVRPTADSTAAFQIQNAAATTTLFNANTSTLKTTIRGAAATDILTIQDNATGGQLKFGSDGVGQVNVTLGSAGSLEAKSGQFQIKGTGSIPIALYTNSTQKAILDTSGNFGIGITPTASLGLLQLASGTTAASGIGFGTDTNLYRSNSSELTTNSDLVIQGNDLSTNQTTFNLINTNAATLNIGGAVTAAGGGLNLAGGSGAGTGCSIDGTNGNLTCSGTITGTGGTYLNKNNADTSAFAVTASNYLYGFTNSSSAVASGVLNLDNGTNTGNTLRVTTAGNPGAGNALIFASNTNASPSGNLIDLQSGASPTSMFSVSATGVTNIAGILNANATGKTAIQIADSGAQSSGITIGGDTNLYRSAANTLKTDDNLEVVGTSTLTGNVAIGTAVNAAYKLNVLSTVTDPASGQQGVRSVLSSTQTAANANSLYGVYGDVTVSGTGGNTGIVTGVYGNATYNNTGVGTNINGGNFIATQGALGGGASTARGIYSRVDNNSTNAITTAYGLNVGNNIGTGNIANNTGIMIGALTGTTSAYGIQIATPSAPTAAALYLSSADGTAASGIKFGTDSSLYRSAGNELTTGGDFIINGGDLTSTAATFNLLNNTAQTAINVMSGNITAATQTINIAGGTSTTSGGKVVNIANGTPGAGTTNTIAVGAGGTTTGTVGVTIGSNGNAAHTTSIQGGNGVGAISLTPQTTGTIVIGAAAGTGNITLGSSSGTQTVLIGNGAGQANVSIANASTTGAVSVGTAFTTGTITLGGTAQTGTLTVGQSTASNTINIGNATIATGNTGTINIGTSATGTGKTVTTIGSTNDASSVTIQAGTGKVNINSTGQTAIQISDSGAQSSGITIGGDTNLYRGGAGLLQTDGNFKAYKSIELGTGEANPNLSIGDNASNSFTLGIASSGGSYSDIASTGDAILRAETGSLVLAARNATGSLLFTTGATDSTVASIANDGAALFKNSANSATAFRIQDSSNNNYLLVNTSGASISVGNTGIASTVQIGNTTGAVAQTLNFGTNATASSTNTIHIGDGANATNTITLGSNSNTSNTLAIEAGTGASAIQIGNGATAHGIKIGTDSGAAQTIGIGSTNASSATNIQGGATGGINIGTIGSTATASTVHIADTTGNALQQVTIGGTGNTGNYTVLQGGSNGTTGGVMARADGTAAFRIQSANGSTTIFNADVTTTRITIGGASGSLANRNLEVARADITTQVHVGNGSNYIETDATTGQLRFTGNARNDIAITLSPEFAGAVLTGDGSSNVGTMTSDFCSGSARLNINPLICTVTTEDHNYYSWTSASATQDYDIYTKWRVPSDFAAFASTAAQFNAFRTNTGDTVTVTFYEGSTSCGSASASSNGAWALDSISSLGGCTIDAGDELIIKTSLTVGTGGDFARIGEIYINYKSKF